MYGMICLFLLFLCIYFLCYIDLDHTADIQLHSWGETLCQAFENMIPCMFNYVTDLSLVDVDSKQTIQLVVKGEVATNKLH